MRIYIYLLILFFFGYLGFNSITKDEGKQEVQCFHLPYTYTVQEDSCNRTFIQLNIKQMARPGPISFSGIKSYVNKKGVFLYKESIHFNIRYLWDINDIANSNNLTLLQSFKITIKNKEPSMLYLQGSNKASPILGHIIRSTLIRGPMLYTYVSPFTSIEGGSKYG